MRDGGTSSQLTKPKDTHEEWEMAFSEDGARDSKLSGPSYNFKYI